MSCCEEIVWHQITSLGVGNTLKGFSREARPRPVRVPILADRIALEDDQEEKGKMRQCDKDDQPVEKVA